MPATERREEGPGASCQPAPCLSGLGERGTSGLSEERSASERRLRTTDRILPSCEATWGQEGPPGE
ncbi:Sulfurtransferase TusD, partial [Dissostichus eleginoides]